MKFNRILVCLIILSFGLSAHAQEHGTGPREKTVKEELRTNKQLRREAHEKRKKEKAERKAIKKHHKRIQTKSVRKRMKDSRKKAIRHHDNKREPFFRRVFRRKK